MYEIRLNKRNKTIKVVHRPQSIRLEHRGKPGPEGPQGIQGLGLPAGGDIGQIVVKQSNIDYDTGWFTPLFSDKTFTQDFTTSTEVIINHGLSKYPSVTVIDSAGSEVIGDVEYIDTSSVKLLFSAPFSGKAICN